MPPMIFKEGKEVAGVEADLAKALGRELGRPIKFVEIPWTDLIDSLEADKIDIIMSSMSVTRARMARVKFSEPYLRVGQMALVRGEDKFKYAPLGNSLAKETIGLKKATTGDLLVQQEFPKAKRKYFDTGDEAAKALSKKKIDLYFSDSTLIYYLSGKYENDGLVAAPLIFSDETLAWAMRRSDEQLTQAVNKALKTMTESGELGKVLRRWIPKFE
jgi:ABC-type amino acid transport substrate-binding protein